MIIAVAGFLVVFPAPAFLLLDTGNPALIVLVIVIGFVFAAYGTVGSQGAAFAELAGSRHRYAGVAPGREFFAVIGGGIAPFVSGVLDRSGRLHGGHHARLTRHGDPDAPRPAAATCGCRRTPDLRIPRCGHPV